MPISSQSLSTGSFTQSELHLAPYSANCVCARARVYVRVSPAALPDGAVRCRYYKVIKRPMDFGTILEKLRAKKYPS